MLELVRAANMAAVDDPDTSYHTSLGGATYIEGIYVAAHAEPDNTFVKYIKREGLKSVMRMYNEAPTDIKLWAKRESNSTHGGSEMTVVEVFTFMIETEEQWNTERKEKNIEFNTCPSKGDFTYAKIYAAFVRKTAFVRAFPSPLAGRCHTISQLQFLRFALCFLISSVVVFLHIFSPNCSLVASYLHVW